MVPAEAKLWQPNWGSQTDQEQPVKKNKQTKQRETETEIAREQKAEMKNTGFVRGQREEPAGSGWQKRSRELSGLQS